MDELSNHAGGVAGGLEDLRERGGAEAHPLALVDRVGHAGLELVPAGHERRPRRRADGRWTVRVGHAHPARGERINNTEDRSVKHWLLRAPPNAGGGIGDVQRDPILRDEIRHQALVTRYIVARQHRRMRRTDERIEPRLDDQGGRRDLREARPGVERGDRRQDREDDTEFMTISYWESVEAMAERVAPGRVSHSERARQSRRESLYSRHGT